MRSAMHLPSAGYAPRIMSRADAEFVELALLAGIASPHPRSRSEVVKDVDEALAQLQYEREYETSLIVGVDHEGEPELAVPWRYADRVRTYLLGLIEADRLSLEAKRAEFAGSNGAQPEEVSRKLESSLAALMQRWQAERRPQATSISEMENAIRRFEATNAKLLFTDITDEHARRFKDALIADPKLKNRSKEKLWSMMRALIGTACDDGLLGANPFSRVKLKLEDDSEVRQDLIQADLIRLFAELKGDEWWLARIALYTGARLGEIVQLTKSDVALTDEVPSFSIRPDAETGKRVKTRNSIRQVPIHAQLIADGILDWVGKRPTDALFPWSSRAASKRMNRRMGAIGLSDAKVFHSFRHTFKSAARTVMSEEWHDKLTGHASQKVGRQYGSFRELKAKIDQVRFGIET